MFDGMPLEIIEGTDLEKNRDTLDVWSLSCSARTLGRG